MIVVTIGLSAHFFFFSIDEEVLRSMRLGVAWNGTMRVVVWYAPLLMV